MLILWIVQIFTKITRVSLDSPALRLRQFGIGQNIGVVSKSHDVKNEFILTIKDPKVIEKLGTDTFHSMNTLFGAKIYNGNGCLTAIPYSLEVRSCIDDSKFEVLTQRFSIKKSEPQYREDSIENIQERDYKEFDEHMSKKDSRSRTEEDSLNSLIESENRLIDDDIFPSKHKRPDPQAYRSKDISNLKRDREEDKPIDKSILKLNGKHVEHEDPIEDFILNH